MFLVLYELLAVSAVDYQSCHSAVEVIVLLGDEFGDPFHANGIILEGDQFKVNAGGVSECGWGPGEAFNKSIQDSFCIVLHSNYFEGVGADGFVIPDFVRDGVWCEFEFNGRSSADPLDEVVGCHFEVSICRVRLQQPPYFHMFTGRHGCWSNPNGILQ